MLNFKKTEAGDIWIFKQYEDTEDEFSCETAFVNLVIWQCAYNNMFAVCDGQLIIKSTSKSGDIFRLPFGDDFEKGVDIIKKYSGKDYPDFWVQDGKRLDMFLDYYGQYYTLTEDRNAFDYIYNRSNLADLSGKKYHSKRNHISAFSKKHDWHYAAITKDNINDILICAEKWYAENSVRTDKYLLCEKQGLVTILNNMKPLAVSGAAIYVDGGVAAFTLGSAINSEVFDIHIEKALSQYSEAYTVINREFAKNALSSYKYINREDDMGLEGLRKAKLSYKPSILLKKYSARQACHE